MANTKLPDTFNEAEFKKDYLNNVKPSVLMTKYNMSETQVYGYIDRNNLKSRKTKLNAKIDNKIEETIQDKIAKNSDKVINKLISIVDNSSNESNVIKACESILSISGLKKQTLDNNVKKYQDLPDMPTEFIMLRDRARDN